MPISCRATICLLITFLLPLATVAAGTPSIACSEVEYQFGAMEDKLDVEHVFTIRNQGDAPLVIGNVRACCGATATISTNTIAPGSNAALKVVFALRGRNGEQHKAIYVASNDPKSPYLQLRLIGRVVPALEIRPAGVEFGALRQEQSSNVEVVVTGNREGTLQITNAVYDTGKLAVEWLKGESQNVWRVQIATKPPLAIGTTNLLITLQTSQPEYARIQIPVRMTVLGELLVVPQEILVSAGPGPVTRYVTIRARSGKPFRILKTMTPDPQITVACEALPSGGYRLTLGNIVPGKRLEGKELIVITDFDQGAMTVPLRSVGP